MLAIRNIEISKKEIGVHRSGQVGHYWHFPENCPLIKVFNRVCWTRTFVMFSSKWNQKASQKRNRFFGWFIIWICHLPVMRHEQVCGASLFSPAPPHRSPAGFLTITCSSSDSHYSPCSFEKPCLLILQGRQDTWSRYCCIFYHYHLFRESANSSTGCVIQSWLVHTNQMLGHLTSDHQRLSYCLEIRMRNSNVKQSAATHIDWHAGHVCDLCYD